MPHDLVLEKGYTNFEIYGGLGGRLDHTLANIQTLTFLNRHNAVGTLIGDDYALKVVTNGVITFGKDLPENTTGNICSVFSLSDVSTNVTIQGFHYEVEGRPSQIHSLLVSAMSLPAEREASACQMAH